MWKMSFSETNGCLYTCWIALSIRPRIRRVLIFSKVKTEAGGAYGGGAYLQKTRGNNKIIIKNTVRILRYNNQSDWGHRLQNYMVLISCHLTIFTSLAKSTLAIPSAIPRIHAHNSIRLTEGQPHTNRVSQTGTNADSGERQTHTIKSETHTHTLTQNQSEIRDT